MTNLLEEFEVASERLLTYAVEPGANQVVVAERHTELPPLPADLRAFYHVIAHADLMDVGNGLSIWPVDRVSAARADVPRFVAAHLMEPVITFCCDGGGNYYCRRNDGSIWFLPFPSSNRASIPVGRNVPGRSPRIWTIAHSARGRPPSIRGVRRHTADLTAEIKRLAAGRERVAHLVRFDGWLCRRASN